MAKNPKVLRKWVKEEKRIITLMYQKGLLKGNFDVSKLYWAYYKYSQKRFKTKLGYSYHIYFPEIHYCTCDYWGEYDEHSVVDMLLNDLYWSGYVEPEFNQDGTILKKEQFTFKYKKRSELLPYLKALPTVIKDSKINRVLYQNNC